MISKHCGKRLRKIVDTADLTTWVCHTCERTFTQSKRKKGFVRKLIEYPGTIYCDVHTTIHAEDQDPYNYGDPVPECTAENWRPLYIEQHYEGEEL